MSKQIKDYAFAENPLLAILASGVEIRLYSLLRGIAFEKSLLYIIKIKEITQDCIWQKLVEILSHDSLKNRTAEQCIQKREREIKQVIEEETKLQLECDEKIENIVSMIDSKEDEIAALHYEKEQLSIELGKQCEMLWQHIGLHVPSLHRSTIDFSMDSDEQNHNEYICKKAGKVSFSELADHGLIKDGQKLFLYCNGTIRDEQVFVSLKDNKIKYKDGKYYSPSRLALEILKRRKLTQSRKAIRGPDHWQTESGELLTVLHDKVRKMKEV